MARGLNVDQTSVASRSAGGAQAPDFDRDSVRSAMELIRAEDWTALCALLDSHRARGEESVARRNSVLDQLAAARIEDYRSVNTERFLALIEDLGLDPEGKGLDALGQCAYEDSSYAQVARELAQKNLVVAADKGSRFTPSYVAEHISTGWRNSYLGQLRALSLGEGVGLLADIIDGSCARTGQDAETYRQRLYALVERHGTKRVERVLDHRFWWKMLVAHKQAQRPADGAELLLSQLEARL